MISRAAVRSLMSGTFGSRITLPPAQRAGAVETATGSSPSGRIAAHDLA